MAGGARAAPRAGLLLRGTAISWTRAAHGLRRRRRAGAIHQWPAAERSPTGASMSRKAASRRSQKSGNKPPALQAAGAINQADHDHYQCQH